MGNPHLFTHLFYGGVILSSRRLDYDPDSEEDMVKNLMQSQHKAVAKDLKIGTFDDKIDSYLGDNPELLARKNAPPAAAKAAAAKVAAAEVAAAEVAAAEVADTEIAAAEVADTEIVAQVTAPDTEVVAHVTAPEVAADLAAAGDALAARTKAANTAAENSAAAGKAAGRDTAVPGKVDVADTAVHNVPPAIIAEREAQSGSTPTIDVKRSDTAELFGEDTQELSEIAAKVTNEHNTKIEAQKLENAQQAEKLARQREIHAEEMFADARSQMSEPEQSVTAAPSDAETHVDSSVPSHISEAGTHSGSYAIARPKRGTSPKPIAKAPSRPVAKSANNPHKQTQAMGRVPRTKQPTGKVPREGQPAAPSSRRRSNTLQQSSGPKPTGKTSTRPTKTRRRSSVVVSRPAVIIGAPPKVIGGERPRRPTARKARSNLFGKDLISEKSLDEVIMAYLSEDGNEEK